MLDFVTFLHYFCTQLQPILYIGIRFLCMKFVTFCVVSALIFGQTVYRNEVFMLIICEMLHYYFTQGSATLYIGMRFLCDYCSCQ